MSKKYPRAEGKNKIKIKLIGIGIEEEIKEHDLIRNPSSYISY